MPLSIGVGGAHGRSGWGGGVRGGTSCFCLVKDSYVKSEK